jgi:predicted nucleic acid-binding protein
LSVDILLTEHSRSRLVDRGEAEAVLQAATLGTMVVVDDRRGVTWPKPMVSSVTGHSGC